MELENLGYKYYFPIFLEGLRETQEPYKFLAEQGCYGLIARGQGKIKEVLPDIVIPLKKALHTKDPEIMCKTLKIIQKLVSTHPEVGEDLVPYYKALFPMLNLFINKTKHYGDKMDYSQQKNMNLSELIRETLEVLERHGGEEAYISIKYMIPTYESCIL